MIVKSEYVIECTDAIKNNKSCYAKHKVLKSSFISNISCKHPSFPQKALPVLKRN